MFGLNESTQFYVCQRYVRMNLGINGLYQIVRTEMKLPPLGGAVFIFFSKNRQQVKLLKWDGDGFLLYQKRLERGTFELPFFDPKNKQCKHALRNERSACYDRSSHGCRAFEDVASLRDSYLHTLQHGTHQVHQDRVSHQHLYGWKYHVSGEDSAGSVVEFFLFTFLYSRSPADAIHLFHAGRANYQILCRQWVYVKESYGKQADL